MPSNAFPVFHEEFWKKLQLNWKMTSIREAIGSNKKDFKDGASSRGTETSQDFVKVENFYFAKRTGEDRSYTCSVRRRAGPEAFKVRLEDVQASPYKFIYSFILKPKFLVLRIKE